MKTIEEMKQDPALHLNEQAIKNHEDRLFKAIFKNDEGKLCDCELCQYQVECAFDNPDFDANYCKLN